MKQNMLALLIGTIGAALTLFAYSQTFVSPGQCITLGLLVLVFGLLVGEASWRTATYLVLACIAKPRAPNFVHVKFPALATATFMHYYKVGGNLKPTGW